MERMVFTAVSQSSHSNKGTRRSGDPLYKGLCNDLARSSHCCEVFTADVGNISNRGRKEVVLE